MSYTEKALCFACGDSWLYGVLSMPQQPPQCGVVVVVGGPQYRAGSHRQFTLLARDFASHGFPVIRFDYRGMGDSEGAQRTFDEVGDDLRAAVNCLLEEAPSLKEVVIWGLCDGASAALLYAHQDARVTGIVLVNPWIRTEEGIAKTYLKHYYLQRLMSGEFWHKLRSGRFDVSASLGSFLELAGSAMSRKKKLEKAAYENETQSASWPERMLDALKCFNGKVLLILSGNDLTAREFIDVAGGSRKWRKLMKSRRINRIDLPEANHTFSRRVWREQVSAETMQWLKRS